MLLRNLWSWDLWSSTVAPIYIFNIPCLEAEWLKFRYWQQVHGKYPGTSKAYWKDPCRRTIPPEIQKKRVPRSLEVKRIKMSKKWVVQLPAVCFHWSSLHYKSGRASYIFCLLLKAEILLQVSSDHTYEYSSPMRGPQAFNVNFVWQEDLLFWLSHILELKEGYTSY